jgi:cellulose synthase/poly-beta-1,6-N-acetylglucosamine synthase-like glycosyltransferase
VLAARGRSGSAISRKLEGGPTMTMRIRVSIVIPVHNEEDTIGPCLDAIFGQTAPIDEVTRTTLVSPALAGRYRCRWPV